MAMIAITTSSSMRLNARRDPRRGGTGNFLTGCTPQDGTGTRRTADHRGREFGPEANAASETAGGSIDYPPKSQKPANRTRKKGAPGLSPQLLTFQQLVDRPAERPYTAARSARPVSPRSGFRGWAHE